jgi:hypothetical protein
MGTGGSYPGGKADHSPPPTAKVKNVWSYTSTPSIGLHGVVLNEARSTWHGTYLSRESNIEICCFPSDWVWWSSLGLSAIIILRIKYYLLNVAWNLNYHVHADHRQFQNLIKSTVIFQTDSDYAQDKFHSRKLKESMKHKCVKDILTLTNHMLIRYLQIQSNKTLCYFCTYYLLNIPKDKSKDDRYRDLRHHTLWEVLWSPKNFCYIYTADFVVWTAETSSLVPQVSKRNKLLN